MNYYVGNGVYDFLINHQKSRNFFWTSGNIWLLVYGDEQNEPKVLTVASGNKLEDKTAAERCAMAYGIQVTRNTDVPVNFVRFDPSSPIEQVRYWAQGTRMTAIISSKELWKMFQEYGLYE